MLPASRKPHSCAVGLMLNYRRRSREVLSVCCGTEKPPFLNVGGAVVSFHRDFIRAHAFLVDTITGIGRVCLNRMAHVPPHRRDALLHCDFAGKTAAHTCACTPPRRPPCIVMTFGGSASPPRSPPPCQVWRLAPSKHGVRLCWNHHSLSLSGRQKVVRLHRARLVWQCNAQYSRRVVNTQKITPVAHP